MQRKLNRDHALAPHRHSALEAYGFLFPLVRPTPPVQEYLAHEKTPSPLGPP